MFHQETELHLLSGSQTSFVDIRLSAKRCLYIKPSATGDFSRLPYTSVRTRRQHYAVPGGRLKRQKNRIRQDFRRQTVHCVEVFSPGQIIS